MFNAETLVLICFASFVGRLAIRGRDGVVGFFEERNQQIIKESYAQRENLVKYYEAYAAYLTLEKNIRSLVAKHLTFYQYARLAREAKAAYSLQEKVRNHVQEQCKRIVTLESKTFQTRQDQIATTVPAYVELQCSNGTINRDERLEECIDALEEEYDEYDGSNA